MSRLSPDDFSILSDPETAALVETHLADDPARLALRLKGDREQARLVCQQVKYLQRAKSKLPSYYAARCIVPPLAYEQCSSEAAASGKNYSGKLCIDLTGGLGVDSYHFSKHFGQVITIERDPVLASVSRHNFALLGGDNITVENTSAEEFLSRYDGPKADLIYLDPARRNEGKRVFLLEDCSPNALELLPLLLKWGERVVVKLSPLFDIDEAIRVFGPHLSLVEVVSVAGEVKELLVELMESPEPLRISVNIAGHERYLFTPEDREERISGKLTTEDYLLIPDAAFYKGRLVGALFHRYFAEDKIIYPEKNGFAFACHLPEGFPGRAYRIEERMPYRPKQLKKWFSEQSIARVNILRRRFPFASEEIKQALRVKEGGADWLAFTEIAGENWVFRVAPVTEK